MRTIFLCLLSGYLLKLLLLENSIALQASRNIHLLKDSFKSANYIVEYASFFMSLQQNGTERHLNLTFINIEYTENFDSNISGSEWLKFRTTSSELNSLTRKPVYQNSHENIFQV